MYLSCESSTSMNLFYINRNLMKKHLFLCFGIFVLALFACSKNKPEDSVQPNTKPSVFVASFDGSVYSVNPSDGSIYWTFKTGKYSVSSPTYSNGTVFIGNSDSSFYAIDAASGSLKWKFTTGGIIVSSPFVSDDIVFVGSSDGNLYALNIRTGLQIWKSKVGNSAFGSPSVSQNLVFIAASGAGTPNPFVLVALDAMTGQTKWTISSSQPFSDVRVRGSYVFYGNGNKLICANVSNGSANWSYMTQRLTGFTNPIVVGDFVFASSDSLYAFNRISGSRLWTYGLDMISALRPVASDTIVYHAYGPGTMSAIRTTNGAEKWKMSITGQFNTNPTLADETIYIGSNDFNLYAIDAKSGNVKWRMKAAGEITSSACVVTDLGKVFHSSESGY